MAPLRAFFVFYRTPRLMASVARRFSDTSPPKAVTCITAASVPAQGTKLRRVSLQLHLLRSSSAGRPEGVSAPLQKPQLQIFIPYRWKVWCICLKASSELFLFLLLKAPAIPKSRDGASSEMDFKSESGLKSADSTGVCVFACFF